jgi:hypothetical protein
MFALLIGKLGVRGIHRAKDLTQAIAIYEQKRDESGEGASTWPSGIVKQDGRIVGCISYNGRYWPAGDDFFKVVRP